MNIQEAIETYTNSTRTRLLSSDLTVERIELVFKLDQAVEVAKRMASSQSPFSVEITDENMEQLEGEAEEFGDRVSDSWMVRLGQISFLMNYAH